MFTLATIAYPLKAGRTLHIVHPQCTHEMDTLTIMAKCQSVVSQVVNPGSHMLTTARYDYFDLVIVHPCPTKYYQDWLRRLSDTTWLKRIIHTAHSSRQAIVFYGNVITMLGRYITYIPNASTIFLNKLIKSLKIDITTPGLGIMTTYIDTDYSTKKKNSRYIQSIRELSHRDPIVILDNDTVYVSNYGVRHGKMYLISQGKITEIKKLKPYVKSKDNIKKGDVRQVENIEEGDDLTTDASIDEEDKF